MGDGQPPSNQHSKEWGELEAELRAPADTLARLLRSDDWAFIIGIHALIEGAVSQMLTAAVDPRLEPIFVKMGMNQRFGKLDFARRLELLGPTMLAFIDLVSGIRNALAHGLHYLDFTIDGYVGSLDAKGKERFFGVLEAMPPTLEAAVWSAECRTRTKEAFMACTVALIREALQAGSFHQITREEAHLALKDMMEGRTVPFESWMDPDSR
ncbi:MAG: hypothetical protein IT177_24085 [Acidobacteria bacterium]|nr:hypothetical protein [Acidobacteriota bacterium]